MRDTKVPKAADCTGGWVVNYYGEPVQDVDSSWRAMLVELDLPLEREWKAYLPRHSLATIVRSAGVPMWRLQDFMGHSAGGQIQTYAVEDGLSGRARRAANHPRRSRDPRSGEFFTGTGSNVIQLRRPKITG